MLQAHQVEDSIKFLALHDTRAHQLGGRALRPLRIELDRQIELERQVDAYLYLYVYLFIYIYICMKYSYIHLNSTIQFSPINRSIQFEDSIQFHALHDSRALNSVGEPCALFELNRIAKLD